MSCDMEITISTVSNSITLSLSLGPAALVSDLKEKIAEEILVPSKQQRIVIDGTALDNEVSLADCGVSTGCNLQLVILSEFDAFEITELNELCGFWTGFWRYAGALEVSGLELPELNGEFIPTRIHNERSLFSHAGGAIIFFREDSWKLSATGNPDGWTHAARGDAFSPVPPRSGWFTPDAPAPGVRVIERVVNSLGQAPEENVELNVDLLDLHRHWECKAEKTKESRRIGFRGNLRSQFEFAPAGSFLTHLKGAEEGSWSKDNDILRLRWRHTYEQWGSTIYEAILLKGTHFPFLAGRFVEEGEGGQAGVMYFNPPFSKLPVAFEFAKRMSWLGQLPIEYRIPVQPDAVVAAIQENCKDSEQT